MGAFYNEMTVKSLNHTVVRKAFEYEQDQDRHENGHSYSGGMGMASGLTFKLQAFTSIYDAAEYVSETAEKWEEAIAVTVNRENEEAFTYIGAWCSS